MEEALKRRDAPVETDRFEGGERHFKRVVMYFSGVPLIQTVCNVCILFKIVGEASHI
jgi:hypothetical protein